MNTVIDPRVGVTWRTVLLQAAEETRRRGHCQDSGQGKNGERCTIWLLASAKDTLGVPSSVQSYPEAMLAVRRAVAPEGIVVWNRRQTAATVIEMFERAALGK